MGPRPHQDIKAGFPRPDGRRLGVSTRVPYASRARGLRSFSFSLFPLGSRTGPWAHLSERSATSLLQRCTRITQGGALRFEHLKKEEGET